MRHSGALAASVALVALSAAGCGAAPRPTLPPEVYTAHDPGMPAKADASERDRAASLGTDITRHTVCRPRSNRELRCRTRATAPPGGACGSLRWTDRYVVDPDTGSVGLASPGTAHSGGPYRCGGSP